jgi:hypothetical protein
VGACLSKAKDNSESYSSIAARDDGDASAEIERILRQGFRLPNECSAS